MSRKERQAMERFANFMAEMILKYGPKVLAEIEAEEERKKRRIVERCLLSFMT